MELVSGCKTTSELLKHVRDLVDLAIPEAAMVKVFSSRWGAIRKRLDQFPHHIMELEKSYVSSSSSSSSSSSNTSATINNKNASCCNDLLLSMVKSLVETRDLSERCLEEEAFFGGKLQMQSSLDGLSMKLEMHLQECQLLLRTKMMKDSAAQAAQEEAGGLLAPKESLRWNVKDLLARLEMGCHAESKNKAMESLALLMDEDDKNVLVVAKEGGVQALVHMLNASGGPMAANLRDKALSAVHRLSQLESCEKLLVSEGALAPLVRALEPGSSPHAKEKAASALGNLTSRPENVRAVFVHGGVPALLEICRSGTPAARSAASGVIRNLACSSSSEFRRALVDEGALPVLVGLVKSGTPLAQERACEAIQHLCSADAADEPIRQAAVREGAAAALLAYYDNVQSPKGKEAAMGALANLASSSASAAAAANNVEHLLAAGLVPRLVTALGSGLLTEQVLAASAVCHLAKSAELRRVLGDAGCVPPLVRMLEGKTSTARELAARALSGLLSLASNRAAFCGEERSIQKMVLLLDPSDEGIIDKKFPVCALGWLVGKKKCRKEMVEAGACRYLVKLAETSETFGAKKLLERLEHGKIWGLFRG